MSQKSIKLKKLILETDADTVDDNLKEKAEINERKQRLRKFRDASGKLRTDNGS